ncbi:helix-turn-helix domain-containing protein [Bacillus sp. FJAT-28004]|uniref:helix-turn-helix domain-containing protein n=1 Tax=Bacillus sp. FJAT-28004 TaxID=1679165 RepID=UPI0007C66552|nr:AraC family transcriptional regulator [Bacillus sp. FJAT-28004]
MQETISNTNVSPSKLYRLIGVSYKEFEPHEKHKANINECYRLYIIMDGGGRLVLDGCGFQLERGKCFICEPGATIVSEVGKNGLIIYELIFEILYIERDAQASLKIDAGSLFPCTGEVVCNPFSQCLEWVETLYGFSILDTSDELAYLDQQICFQQLLRHILKQNLTISYTQSSRNAVEATIDRLCREYRNEWSVGQLADLADIGRSQYSRLFKEITGQVPLQYLSGIRIDQAKHLLQVTGDRLSDIALNAGFGDEFYFNRRFKKSVGISPGQYRRHYREEIRVFAPFLEDFLVTLGVTPILQCSISKWGKQSYLGLDHIPAIEISDKYAAQLPIKPDFILVDSGFQDKWDYHLFEEQAPLYKMSNEGEDWRETLRTMADLIGRGKSVKVVDIISKYEQKADAARKKLRAIQHQTTVFLRVSANGILLYGGPEKSYTGPVLYKDLEMTPHPLVKQLTNCTRTAELTPELLAQLDADNLFVTFEITEHEKREFYATSLWQSLPAVRHNRVFEVDFLSWMNYGILAHGMKIDDVLRALA